MACHIKTKTNHCFYNFRAPSWRLGQPVKESLSASLGSLRQYASKVIKVINELILKNYSFSILKTTLVKAKKSLVVKIRKINKYSETIIYFTEVNETMTISKITIRYSLFIQGRAVRVGVGEIFWNQNINGWRLGNCGEVGEGGEGVVVEQGREHPNAAGVPVADYSKHLAGEEDTTREELVDIPKEEFEGDVGAGVKAAGVEGLKDKEHRRSKLIHLSENVLNFPAIHSAQKVATIKAVGHLEISGGRMMLIAMMSSFYPESDHYSWLLVVIPVIRIKIKEK